MSVEDLPGRVAPQLLAEAGVWIARLHGDARSRETEAGFRRWLACDPAHARAFELATEAWEESIHLRRFLPVRTAPPRVRRHAWVALAAVVAALAVGATLFMTHTAGVVTDVGEQRLLTLEDGTRVYLNTASHIVVRYDQKVRRVELREGEALFSVAAQRQRPFVVSVAGREVRALGTAFVVRREAHRVAVTLVEGKVSISERSAPVAEQASSRTPPAQQERGSIPVPTPESAVTLQPGQRVVFASERAAPKIDETSLEQALAWRNGQVVLKDATLESAVAEMNRYSRKAIVIEAPQTRGLLVNGLFQAGDSASFASAVAHTYGLTLTQRGSRILLRGLPTENVQAR